MSVRNDVVRGVRLGAVVLAMLLAGAIVYRVVYFVPAPAAQQSTAPTPESVAQVPPTYPDVPSASAQVPPLPPPPPSPASARPSSVRALPARVSRATPAPVPQPSVEAPVTPPAAVPLAPLSSIERAEPEASPAAPAEGASADSTEPERIAPPAESRGKKMIKAVGRFLHIGAKKDVPAENIKPGKQ